MPSALLFLPTAFILAEPKVRLMTRETKIGLVIAGSFLCLVCIVVASKLHRGEVTPTEAEESTVPMAANHPRDANKGHELPVRSEVIHPKNPTTPAAAGSKSNDTAPKKPDANALPTHSIAAPAPTEDPILREIERQKSLAAGNQAQQMPAGKAIDSQTKLVPPALVQLPGLAPEKKGPEGDYVFVPPPALPAFPPNKEEKPTNTGVNIGSIPAPTTVAAPMLAAPPVPTSTATAPGVAAPGVSEPATGVKKDSFGVVEPMPSPFASSKVTSPAGATETFPALTIKKDNVVSAPSLNAVATPPVNDVKVEQNIPAPPNSGALGQGSLADAKSGFPNALPALNHAPMENPRENPKPGIQGDLPPLNGPLQQSVKETPKIDFALPPAPLSNPPSIPALGKSNDSPRENAPFPPTASPLAPETPKYNPVPTIAGNDAPSLPTITTSPVEGPNPMPSMPPIRIEGNKPTNRVQQTDTDYYVCQPGETNFAAVSRRLYGSDKYGEALFAYNRDHRLGLPNGSNVTASLNPGQPVLNPPRGLLERDYRALIRDLEPNPIAPVVSTSPPVKLAPPSPLTTTPPLTRMAVIPGQNTPGANALVQNAPAPNGPTTDRTQSYVVQNPRGESILDVSERFLGDRGRWHEIYRINPSYRPELTIPAGTSLRVPVQ